MTDLTTMHLKCLLEKSPPGPWEYEPGEGVDERYIYAPTTGMCIAVEENGAGSDCSDYDLELVAHAPELAQEVIHLREQVKGLILAMETKAATGESQSPVTIAGYLKEIVLGEDNEHHA